ncbi:MAG: hypothetical protein N2037_13440 [Acidimicrobiales bacterium]|nr:hypothetical protein [Acidimicrobiales bacterium]
MTTFDARTLDEMVRAARDLVDRHTGRLPDKSGVRTLANFAAATPSVEELALFIEYQAARFPRLEDFYREAAAKVRKDAGNDIERARRFLALLVRAVIARPKPNDGASSNKR